MNYFSVHVHASKKHENYILHNEDYIQKENNLFYL